MLIFGAIFLLKYEENGCIIISEEEDKVYSMIGVYLC